MHVASPYRTNFVCALTGVKFRHCWKKLGVQPSPLLTMVNVMTSNDA